MSPSIADLAAGHAGITNEQARQAVASTLRSAHRIALTDPKGLTALALQMRLEFGSEATYHLFGLLELERRSEFHDLPWSETLLRMDPAIGVYRALVDRWLAGEEDPERLE